jgi:glycogen(starch) synthase
MRVAHLTWEYPPLMHGGLGRHVTALADQQLEQGLDVVVLTCRDDVTGAVAVPPPADEHVAGTAGRGSLTVRRVGLGRAWGDVVADAARWQRALAAEALAALDGVDVVHPHDWMTADAAAAIAGSHQVPWVLTVHATEHGRRQGRLDEPVHRAVHEAERRAVVAAGRVVVCSSAMRAEVVDVLGARPSSVIVVLGGVDARAWSPSPEAVRLAGARWRHGGPLVVAAGRLEWEKGFSTLLRAVPALRERHPGLRVVVAGAGSYRPALARLRDELALADVELPGRLDPADLSALLAAADVVVVPSRYEPFGLVALEAMACGTCVVATRTGGLTETVRDGVTGRLVDVGDVDALASTVHELLVDPDRRARLARAGLDAARRQGWDEVARRVLDVYTSLGPV